VAAGTAEVLAVEHERKSQDQFAARGRCFKRKMGGGYMRTSEVLIPRKPIEPSKPN